MTWFCWFYFILKKNLKNHCFIQEGNPSEKVIIVEEELDDTDIDDIGNLEDSPRLVFIHEKCENLIAVNDDGELTKNINQKKKSGILQQPIDVHYATNVAGEHNSSVIM